MNCGCNHDEHGPRNRFEPDNRFEGDIEDGRRYPFGCYTKREADHIFVKKNEIPDIPDIQKLETDVQQLDTEVENKADKATVDALASTVEDISEQIADGVQSKLSPTNKLNPSYIGYDSAHRAVTDAEKNAWNAKQSQLTQAQINACNSGINSADVAQIVTNKDNINNLSTAIASKASQASVDALEASVEYKATKSEVADLESTVEGKADVSAIADLQAQINNIVTPVTQEAEVENARVGEESTSYTTLKERLDTENSALKNNIASTDEAVSVFVDNSSKKELKKIWKPEDVNLTTNTYPFDNYRGYAYGINVPQHMCGVRLNLLIYGSGVTGNNDVTVTVSLRDKDDITKVIFTKSKVFSVAFANNIGRIYEQVVEFGTLITTPDVAFLAIEVDSPYTLYVSTAETSSMRTSLLDATIKTYYINNSNVYASSNQNSYYCDFGVVSNVISDINTIELKRNVESIEASLDAMNVRKKFFNMDFNLTKNTYAMSTYRGWGYLIRTPRSMSGVWLNAIITPSAEFDTDYTATVRLRVSLRDKQTHSLIYYSCFKNFEVEFKAADGFGKVVNADVIFDTPITDLPEQAYICFDVPIGYTLNVTIDNRDSKFTDLAVLDNAYKVIYINAANYYVTSDGLYKYGFDFGVYSLRYAVKPFGKRRLYNLHDAFLKWMDGEKFPIAFAGDSTTDGYRTTNYIANELGTDHTSGYLYTDVLQAKLREETGNSILRIYNAGFSGKTVSWMLQNFDAEFGELSAYADAKMVGISFGINDKPKTETAYTSFKANLTALCDKCLSYGMQPFLLTSQAGAENSSTLNRYESVIISYANRAKFEVAEEMGLEIIDVSKITGNFLNYSNHPIQSILYDYCHFGDYGHAFEGGMFFREFVPRTITVNGNGKIGFETQGIKSSLEWGDTATKQVTMLDTPYNGFKTKANVSGRSSSDDIVVMDAWIFVDGKSPLTLTGYCETSDTIHAIVDSTDISFTSTEQDLGTLDIGLHHVVIMSGNSTNISFYGLKTSEE